MIIFWIVFMSNLRRLLPFVFCLSAHFSFCIRLRIPLIIGIIILHLVKCRGLMFIKFIPDNSPLKMVIFTWALEVLRFWIRPITLVIRLTANMIVGHLIITYLVRLLVFFLNKIIYLSYGLYLWYVPLVVVFRFPLVLGIFLLEVLVSLVQSYVFVILLTIYLHQSLSPYECYIK